MTARAGATVLTVEAVCDRSNTNPLCPDCDYRTFAIDAIRVACRRCGEIFDVPARAVRLLESAFGAVIVDAEDVNAHWA